MKVTGRLLVKVVKLRSSDVRNAQSTSKGGSNVYQAGMKK